MLTWKQALRLAWGFLGPLLVVGGYVSDGVGIVTLGLPVWAWQAIGALIFFAFVWYLFRQHGIHPFEATAKPSGKVEKTGDGALWRRPLFWVAVVALLLAGFGLGRLGASDRNGINVVSMDAWGVEEVEAELLFLVLRLTNNAATNWIKDWRLSVVLGNRKQEVMCPNYSREADIELPARDGEFRRVIPEYLLSIKKRDRTPIFPDDTIRIVLPCVTRNITESIWQTPGFRFRLDLIDPDDRVSTWTSDPRDFTRMRAGPTHAVVEQVLEKGSNETP